MNETSIIKEKNLCISISCGDKTCASTPGQFCKFFGSKYFGQIPLCMLFPSEDGSHTELQTDIDELSNTKGWTLRCQKCHDFEYVHC